MVKGWIEKLGSEISVRHYGPNFNLDSWNGAEGNELMNERMMDVVIGTSVGQIGHPCDIGQVWHYKHFCYSVKQFRNMVSQLCSFWFSLAKLLITSCSSL